MKREKTRKTRPVIDLPDIPLLPSPESFEDDREGQSGYAAMVGCILMHFLAPVARGFDGEGLPPLRDGWGDWKDLYYTESEKSGLTETEASDFLAHTCVTLVLLGVIDPPPDEGVLPKDTDTVVH